MNTTDGFAYDVFISCSSADRAWADTKLIPGLRRAGLAVATEDDFTIGAPKIENIERLVQSSRRIIVVLSPEWLASEWNGFQILLARSLDPSAHKRKLLPVKLKPCDIPASIASLRLSIADLTAEKHTDRELRRLTRDIRDAVPLPFPAGARGLGTRANWLQWLGRYRRQLAVAALTALAGVLAILMALQWVPFQPRMGWKAVGTVHVKGAWLLERAANVLLVSTMTNFQNCSPEDTGLLRSLDDGHTWERISAPLARSNSPCQLARILSFAHTPISPGVIYAATDDVGLLRSDAAGAAGSWQPMLPSVPISTLYSVAVSPATPGLVFVAARNRSGVYRLTPGAGEWLRIDQPGICPHPGGISLPADLEVRVLLASGRYLYAATDTDGPRPLPGSGIYVSEDDGLCWRLVDDARQKYAYRALAVVPGRSDLILALTEDKTPAAGVNEFNLWTVRLYGGRDVAPLHDFELVPNGIYVQPGTPPVWYAATPLGDVTRGPVDGSNKFETLPHLFYCIVLPSLDQLQTDVCYVSMASRSTTSDEPLLMARDRLYKLDTVAWYNTIAPDAP